MRLLWSAVIVFVLALALVACGGGEGDAPTRVATADLERDAEFWDSLSGDLKAELVRRCREQVKNEIIDGMSFEESFRIGELYDGLSEDRLVELVDREYENEQKREDFEIDLVCRNAVSDAVTESQTGS